MNSAMLSTPTPLATTTGCRTGKRDGCNCLGIVPQAFFAQMLSMAADAKWGVLWVGCVEQTGSFSELQRVLQRLSVPARSAVHCLDSISDHHPAQHNWLVDNESPASACPNRYCAPRRGIGRGKGKACEDLGLQHAQAVQLHARAPSVHTTPMAPCASTTNRS